MKETMQSKISRFNDYAISANVNSMPIGLFCGKIGLSIYFFHQAKETNNIKFKQRANDLLNSLVEQIDEKTTISLEDGLIGVCLGIKYLFDNGFKKGNLNDVLENIDGKIYKEGCEILESEKITIKNLENIILIANYFSIRIQDKGLKKDYLYIYKLYLINLINHIDNTYKHTILFEEPIGYSFNKNLIFNYLLLLSSMYKLKLYTYKIDNIIQGLLPTMITIYPLYQPNRLQLIAVLKNINNNLRNNIIENYIINLTKGIDVKSMAYNDFRNKNIILADGLSGMYFIQNYLHNEDYMDYTILKNRIVNSELWEDIYTDKMKLKASLGLFTGLPGVILIYQKIIKNSHEI